MLLNINYWSERIAGRFIAFLKYISADCNRRVFFVKKKFSLEIPTSSSHNINNNVT